VSALDSLLAAGHDIAAVYTQPDRPSGRGLNVAASPVKRRAIEYGLAIEQPASLRDEHALERLRRLAPEVMVVVAYGLILPVNVLELPALGCVNIHASLLPRWRGAAPIQRAIEAGDEETGVTIMKMDAGLDTGPVLLERRTAIGRDETGGELHDRLAQLGASAVVEALSEWTAGRIVPRPQPGTGVTYAAKIRKDEAAIDWSQPAVRIDAKVRAFNPWPIAVTSLNGEAWRIWSTSPAVDAPTGDAGEIVRASTGELVVAAGTGALRILALQLPGRRVTAVPDFLNAWRGAPLPGQRLGS